MKKIIYLGNDILVDTKYRSYINIQKMRNCLNAVPHFYFPTDIYY